LPALFLLVLAAPSLSLLYIIDEVGFPSVTTKVVGHQWYWRYEASDLLLKSHCSYLTGGPPRLLATDVSVTTFSNLTLRFLISAADVLHSWAIPS